MSTSAGAGASSTSWSEQFSGDGALVSGLLPRQPWLMPVFMAAVVIAAVWLMMRFNLVFRDHRKKLLPPGPPRWPLLGCLPSVGFKHRHRTFYKLSKKYGPVMHVPIGCADFIVVHGTALAEELLKTQDAQFCSRPLSMTGQYLGFEHQDLNLTPYNSNWKAARKAFSTVLLSPSRLLQQAPMRSEELRNMVSVLWQTAKSGEIVNVSKTADDVMTRMIVRMLLGNRYISRPEDPVARALQNFEPDLREGIFLWGELNLAELFPALASWDLQGLERRFKKLRNKLEVLFKLIIDEHKQELPVLGAKSEREDYNFISVTLSQNLLSEKQLMGIMSNALIAGIDTTARAIEWAMAELVMHPEAMARAQEELDRVVGSQRLMSEADIRDLPYLNAIAKEVLRLHPSAPMDDPHLNEHATTLGGYHIPANSIILLNLWALGQDPELWEDPSRFEPARFLASPAMNQLNVYGNNYQLLPFSSGRRKCPAYQMATTTLQLVVGMLLQAFSWAPLLLHDHQKIDLAESDGIVVGLRTPLKLSATPRLSPLLYGHHDPTTAAL